MSSQDAGRTRRGNAEGSDPYDVLGSGGVSVLDVTVAILVSAVVLGPALRPGPLLDLDLLVTPEIPIPNGIWGLGPALSQRVPLFALLGVGSWIVGGPASVKLFLLLGLIIGFVGMARLVAPFAGAPGRLAAALLWVAGPFAVTRIAAGHIQFVWSIAALPWLAPILLVPSRSLRRTFPALVLLAFGGPASGTLAAAVTVAGLIRERRRRPLTVLGSLAAANLVWAAPTVVLSWAGADVAGADRFATSVDGPSGWLTLLIGGGFWSPTRQVGAVGWIAGIAAGVLLGIALVGHRRLRHPLRGLGTVGAIGLGLAAASALPVVRDGYAALSRSPVGAPLRESHRFLLLWLLWFAPAIGAGARRLGVLVRTGLAASSGTPRGDRIAGALGEVARTLPLALLVLVSVGGWWGAAGRLSPVTYPNGWAEVRHELRTREGTIVALPWNEYPPLDFLGGRHAFNPLPDYLGGDVVSSYDPLFDPTAPAQEQVDRRARIVDEGLRGDGPLAPVFDAVGARFLVVVEQRGSAEVTDRLEAEPAGFEVVLENEDVTLWEVRSWAGPVTDPDGLVHGMRRPIAPIIRTDAPPGSLVRVAGAPGWVRGWFKPVSVTETGLLRLPDSGGGPVWFWPAPVLIGIDLVLAAVAIRSVRSVCGEGRDEAPPGEVLVDSHET